MLQNEQEMALKYVRNQLARNIHFRVRLSELFLGKAEDASPECLLAVIKDEWKHMSDSYRLHLAQAIAGANHYNAFLECMKPPEV
mgnify:CR=1 FL=1